MISSESVRATREIDRNRTDVAPTGSVSMPLFTARARPPAMSTAAAPAPLAGQKRKANVAPPRADGAEPRKRAQPEKPVPAGSSERKLHAPKQTTALVDPLLKSGQTSKRKTPAQEETKSRKPPKNGKPSGALSSAARPGSGGPPRDDDAVDLDTLRAAAETRLQQSALDGYTTRIACTFS